MKTHQIKPFWDDMRNPITMHKVTHQDNPKKTLINKDYYKKTTEQ